MEVSRPANRHDESRCEEELVDDFATCEPMMAEAMPLAGHWPGEETHEANGEDHLDAAMRKGNSDGTSMVTSTLDNKTSPCAARANDHGTISDGGAAEPAVAAHASRTRSAAQVAAAAVPLMLLTAANLEVRASAMFVAGKPGPVRSGLDRAAFLPTGELVLLAWKLTVDWPQARIAQLSASFGNFDRVVALGWLIADALDLPLLERNEGEHSAWLVGKAAIYVAKKMDGLIASAKRTISKHPADSTKRADAARAAAALEAKLLSAPVEPALPLPVATAPAASASGSNAPESAASAALSAASAEAKDAQKQLKKAQRVYTAAERMWHGFMAVQDAIELKCKKLEAFIELGEKNGYDVEHMEHLRDQLEAAEAEPFDPPDTHTPRSALNAARRHNEDAQRALAQAETRVLQEQLEALDPCEPATLTELATQHEAAQTAVDACIARGSDGICALLDRLSMIHTVKERVRDEKRAQGR